MLKIGLNIKVDKMSAKFKLKKCYNKIDVIFND